MLQPPRWVALEGAHNMRDLGGLAAKGGRTRSGVLFRSDALELLSVADVESLVGGVGIAHVFDLRSADERRDAGPGPLTGAGVRHRHVPVIDGADLERRRAERADAVSAGLEPDEIMADGYRELLKYGRPAFAAVLEGLVAPDGWPAIVHCSAGKDRTGVIVALLLELVGVSHADIIDDYTLTAERLGAIVERLHQAPAFRAMSDQLPAFVLDARAETMRRFLDRLRSDYGDASGYFATCGVADETIDRWRAQFVEPAATGHSVWTDPSTAA